MASFCGRVVVEASEVAVEGFGDALVAGGLAGPAATFGVGLEFTDVVELGAQGGGELVAGNEVVAGLADVGVGAGVGGEVAGAVAAGESGLEELRGDPVDLGWHLGASGGSDGDELADFAHRFVVGGAQG